MHLMLRIVCKTSQSLTLQQLETAVPTQKKRHLKNATTCTLIRIDLKTAVSFFNTVSVYTGVFPNVHPYSAHA